MGNGMDILIGIFTAIAIWLVIGLADAIVVVACCCCGVMYAKPVGNLLEAANCA